MIEVLPVRRAPKSEKIQKLTNLNSKFELIITYVWHYALLPLQWNSSMEYREQCQELLSFFCDIGEEKEEMKNMK